MPMLVIAAAALLQATVPAAAPFDRAPMARSELAEIRGVGLPTVGTDLVAASARASAIPINHVDQSLSNLIREVMDNWNFMVGTELILAAMEGQRSSAGIDTRLNIGPITWANMPH